MKHVVIPLLFYSSGGGVKKMQRESKVCKEKRSFRHGLKNVEYHEKFIILKECGYGVKEKLIYKEFGDIFTTPLYCEF